jgi:hypothetical protein
MQHVLVTGRPSFFGWALLISAGNDGGTHIAGMLLGLFGLFFLFGCHRWLLPGFFIAFLCFAHDGFSCAAAWNIWSIWNKLVVGP